VKSYQAIVIILLVGNILATFWFGLSETPTEAMTPTQQTAKHDLPKIITANERKIIFSEFQEAFNSSDYDALYDMFGDAAKAQFTKETAREQFGKLSDFFHSAESGAYTHSELTGSKGNTNFYIMYYAVKLSEDSKFGTAGELKVTIAVQGNSYEIYGMHLSGG